MISAQRRWVEAIRDSNARLEEVVGRGGATPDEPSYCPGWSIGHVLSHLGSGAEIGLLNMGPAIAGDPPPPRSRYGEIIGEWNEKPLAGLASEVLDVNARYVETLAALDDDALDALRVTLRGRDLDVSLFAGRRLFEHALHTWDIDVMGEPDAELPASAAQLLVERVLGNLGVLAHGKAPDGAPILLAVSIPESTRSFTLDIGSESVTVTDGSGEDARLEAGAESVVRLICGRLDEAHTPASVLLTGALSLGELRSLFPGVPSPTEP